MFLGSYPDTAAPSLTQYSLPVTIPSNTTTGNYVIQTVSNVALLLHYYLSRADHSTWLQLFLFCRFISPITRPRPRRSTSAATFRSYNLL